jgi:O-antigen/teichoic acid export membrane protein
MAILRKNIIANLLGGFWIGGLTLVITPLQIKILGIESYGLLGLVATLQLVFSAFDLGLSSAVTKELAADQSVYKKNSALLIRTSLLLFWSVAFFMWLFVFLSAEYLSKNWFNSQSLSNQQIVLAIQIVAVLVALRWPIALYSGVLAGIQRMDFLNYVKVFAASLRLVGGLIVLLLWPSLERFLWWLALSGFIEVILIAVVCRRCLPKMHWTPSFSISSIRNIWRFSLGMNVLAIVGILITQSDRLMVSKLLSLENLGYYTLAYTTATSISLVLSAISSATMPSYVSIYSTQPIENLVSKYQTMSFFTLYSTGLISFVLVYFGERLLAIWVGEKFASSAWICLALLSLGFWLSAAVSNAYLIAVSMNRLKKVLRISCASAFIYLPMMYFAIMNFGIAGAASSWLLLNAAYLVLILTSVHKDILGLPVLSWIKAILVPCLALGLLCFGGARWIADYLELRTYSSIVFLLLACVVYICCAYFLVARRYKHSVIF